MVQALVKSAVLVMVLLMLVMGLLFHLVNKKRGGKLFDFATSIDIRHCVTYLYITQCVTL